MARPFRIEFAGALYHVTARDNAQGDIYTQNEDREKYLELLANACKRYDWYCHSYCLMTNHYHLLIETNTPTLSSIGRINALLPEYQPVIASRR